ITVTKSVRQCITCEDCGRAYVFLDEKTATCVASSGYLLDNESAARLAREDAERKVERLLASEVGALPCPHCGWYQRAMLRTIRKPLYAWIPKAAWNLFRFSP